MAQKFENMSKEELLRELKKVRTVEERFVRALEHDDQKRLLYELHESQVELETQNRELRESQALLEESRSRYSDLYDFAPVGYCTLDTAGCIQEINLTGAALLGAFREWIVGQPLASIASVREMDRFQDHLQRCRAGREYVATELNLSASGNRSLVIHMISSPFRNFDGQTTGYRTALVDITALKSLEAKLRFLIRAGTELASCVNEDETLVAAAHLPVPEIADLCFIDLLRENGKVRRPYVVFAAHDKQVELAERLRRSAERGHKNTPQAAVMASGEAVLLEHVRRTSETASHDEDQAGLLRLAGRHSTIIVPLGVSGRTFGALTLVSTQADRTYSSEDLELAEEFARRTAIALDNAKLHERAQREIRSREHLLAAVSHDLRGPLGAVLMGTELMLEHPPGNDRRRQSRKAAESIHRSAKRMNRLIADLLDVASIESGHLSIQPESHHLHELMSDALDAHQQAASAKGLVLESEVADDVDWEVICDRERVVQVFSNLIENALKFTAKGAITVRAEARGNDVLFSVTDTGFGISSEALPRVFDRFFRASKASRVGTGLGLSIARGIVEAHRGRIWAESQEGRGSTFFFTLPIAPSSFRSLEVSHGSAAAEAENETKSVQDSEPPGNKVVLLVEDDPEVRENMSEVLRRERYVVETAANGAEALAYLHAHGAPSLIVLDIVMPVMDGWKFLVERNREPAFRSIPVIIASGENGIQSQAMAANADYLPKPVGRDSLLKAVRSIVS